MGREQLHLARVSGVLFPAGYENCTVHADNFFSTNKN
jgi:hypothetical protein